MFEYFRHAEHICFFLWRIIISVAPSDMEEFPMRVLASAFPFGKQRKTGKSNVLQLSSVETLLVGSDLGSQ